MKTGKWRIYGGARAPPYILHFPVFMVTSLMLCTTYQQCGTKGFGRHRQITAGEITLPCGAGYLRLRYSYFRGTPVSIDGITPGSTRPATGAQFKPVFKRPRITDGQYLKDAGGSTVLPCACQLPCITLQNIQISTDILSKKHPQRTALLKKPQHDV